MIGIENVLCDQGNNQLRSALILSLIVVAKKPTLSPQAYWAEANRKDGADMRLCSLPFRQ